MPFHEKDNSAMTFEEVKRVQERLDELGFEPGPIDGMMGPQTESAIVAYKRSRGLRPRPWVGPKTWAKLMGPQPKPMSREEDNGDDLPWMKEGKRVLNLHEIYDNKELTEWLASDGHALGDPSEFPWCGDFVETAIRSTLPKEKIMKNPYWALNWQKWGIQTKPTYGCIFSIKRRGGGHVGFIVGEDATRYYCLGGNQANRVSIVPTAKNRFEPKSFRWPRTFPQRPIELPWMQTNQRTNTREG